MEVLKNKVKPKMLPLYLSETMKQSIEIKAASLGLTANGYIKMLISNDLSQENK